MDTQRKRELTEDKKNLESKISGLRSFSGTSEMIDLQIDLLKEELKWTNEQLEKIKS